MTGICAVDGCGKPVQAKGLCTKHYQRQRRHGSPTVALRPRYEGVECSVDGCGRQAYSNGLCRLHYDRTARDGETGPAGSTRGGTPVERALRKIDTSGPGEHWVWTGQVRNSTPVLPYEPTLLSARRVMYEDATGTQLGPDQYVRRTCAVTECVNPAHSVVVTKKPVTSR